MVDRDFHMMSDNNFLPEGHARSLSVEQEY